MPLRHLFARTKHPVAYSTILLIIGMLSIMGISTCASIRASERAGERAARAVQAQAVQEAADRQALERQRELETRRVQIETEAKQRAAICALVRAQLEAYRDPSTPTGERALVAWRNMGQLFKC